DDLYREKLFSEFWNVDVEKLGRDLLDAGSGATYAHLCRIVMLNASPEKKNARVIVDKNPMYYYFLREIREIFPEAKFIHLVRDYRGNIASHKKVFLMKKVRDIAWKWLWVNREIEALKKNMPGSFFTLRYEDVVANPGEEMKKICGFLGVDYSAEMISDHTEKIYPAFRNKKDAPGFGGIHASLFGKMSPEIPDKWKKELSPGEILAAEKIDGDFGKKMYGYEPTIPPGENHSAPAGIFVRMKFFMVRTFTRIFVRNRLTSPAMRLLMRTLIRIYKS
ncbi:MAG TPA: sulfotransferase, partial [Bacteroidia bacterium]|nr:sulfotransferase [Bacteroidia bacterium]